MFTYEAILIEADGSFHIQPIYIFIGLLFGIILVILLVWDLSK